MAKSVEIYSDPLLPTPFVAIDRNRVLANIAAMQGLASGAGVGLRPHTKTHKSPVIARWQLNAGAIGICCAKLAEAEVFAAAGFTDIRLPYPVHPTNADRVRALLERGTTLSIIVDDAVVAAEWSAAMQRFGRQLDVLVKVDVGLHRCGIDPERPDAAAMVRHVAALPGLRFLGLLSHAGHGYLAPGPREIEAIATSEAMTLNALAAELRVGGTEVREISVGATPTARFIGRQQGITEMRPGAYVFCDRTQVGVGAADLEDCAMSIISTVVSRPARDRVILDAGSKTLSNDTARGFTPTPGYGLVFPTLAATVPDPSIVIERLSEEHATTRVAPDNTLKPGDRVRIVPNHTCVVTNLANELTIMDGDTVLERMPVAARGKNY